MKKLRRAPIRTCVVCRQSSEKRDLLRVVRLPEKEGAAIVADPTGKRAGRGAYVCAELDCIEKARKSKRFERALAAGDGAASPRLYEELMSLAQARSTIDATSVRSDPPMK